MHEISQNAAVFSTLRFKYTFKYFDRWDICHKKIYCILSLYIYIYIPFVFIVSSISCTFDDLASRKTAVEHFLFFYYRIFTEVDDSPTFYEQNKRNSIIIVYLYKIYIYIECRITAIKSLKKKSICVAWK